MKNYILLLISVMILWSCRDNVEMKETDLTKYSWLTPFLEEEIKEFDGTHNIDIGMLRFNYTSSIKNKNIFLQFDSIARNEGWTIVSSSEMTREYSKKMRHYKEDTSYTVIKIEIDTVQNKLYYEIN